MFQLRKGNKITLFHDRRDFASRLKSLLGFRPANLRLYETAFIHRSASYSLPDGTRINNERLEYLGDAILDTIVSEYLFHVYPEATEGLMTKSRSRIVNRDMLNQLAMAMRLDNLIVSNITVNDSSRNLCGNALEALIGALFLDIGYERTRKFFLDKALKKHINLNEVLESETDFKSMILEYGQKNRLNVRFRSEEETDPLTLKPSFTVTLEINNEVRAMGHGISKKEAEQDAAMTAWTKMQTEL